jgi:hypothetical protein
MRLRLGLGRIATERGEGKARRWHCCDKDFIQIARIRGDGREPRTAHNLWLSQARPALAKRLDGNLSNSASEASTQADRRANSSLSAAAVQTSTASLAEVTGEAQGVCVCDSIGLMQVAGTQCGGPGSSRKRQEFAEREARESISVPTADRCRRLRRRRRCLLTSNRAQSRRRRNNARLDTARRSTRFREFSIVVLARVAREFGARIHHRRLIDAANYSA